MKNSFTHEMTLSLLCLLLSWGAVAQTTRHVSVSGTDTGDCSSPGSPCRTIAYAVGQAVAGDTVKLSAGTHAGSVSINKANLTIQGSSKAGTVVKAGLNADTPVFTVTSNGTTFRDMTLTNDGVMVGGIWVNGASSGLRVERVQFSNIGKRTSIASFDETGSGIRFFNGFTNVAIDACNFISAHQGVRSTSSGIISHQKSAVFQNFTVTNSTFEKLFMGIWWQAPMNGLTVEGNTFGPMEVEDAFSGSAGMYIGDLEGSISNVRVENNNFVTYSRGVYLYNYSGGETDNIQTLTIKNNTFTNSIWSSPVRIIATRTSRLEGPLTIEDNTFTQTVANTFTDGLAMIDIRQGRASDVHPIEIRRNKIRFLGNNYTRSTWGMLFRGQTTNLNISMNELSGGNVGGASLLTPATSGIVFQTNISEFGAMPETANVQIQQNSITSFTNGIAFYNYVNNVYGDVTAGAKIKIFENNLADNTDAINAGAGELIEATCNWYGTYTATEVAAKVKGNVQYTPFLFSGSDAQTGIVGFQPTPSCGGFPIEVRGNGLMISYADTMPQLIDNTDFGISCDNIFKEFRVTNPNSVPLVLPFNAVSLTGPDAAFFSVVSQPSGNLQGMGTLPFTIQFSSETATCAPCKATVTVQSDLGVPFFFAVRAEGKRKPNAQIVNLTGQTELNCAAPVIRLLATGGGTYLWNNNLTTGEIEVVQGGSYSVTVTAANGCTDQDEIFISEDYSLPTASITLEEGSGLPNDGTLCPTEPAGSARLTALGSGTFVGWSTGASTAQITVSPTSATQYVAVFEGDNGCRTEARTTINVAERVTLTAIPTNTCLGEATGTVVLLVGPATSNLNYTWSNGANTKDIRTLSQGMYSVVAVDLSGCSYTATATVGVAPVPVLDLSAPEYVCAGGQVVVSLQASESMQVRYQFGTNAEANVNLTNTAFQLSLNAGTTGATQVFRIVSARSLINGCSVGQLNQREIQTIPTPAINTDNITTCSDVAFNLPVRSEQSGSAFIVQTSWAAQYNGLSGGAGAGVIELNAGMGSVIERLINPGNVALYAQYTLTPRISIQSVSCAGEPQSVRVEVLPEPDLNPLAVEEVCSGSTFVLPLEGRVQGSTFSWSRTTTGASVTGIGDIQDAIENNSGNIEAYNYQVRVIANGCSGAEYTVSVRVRPAIELILTPPADACSGVADLTSPEITAGSAAGLTFSYWTDRNLTLSVPNPRSVVPGLYFIEAEDAAGCSASDLVRVRAAVQLQVHSPEPVCKGQLVDLTAPSITTGSTANLTFTYWRDANATLSLDAPDKAGAGTYYIRGTQSGGGSCFSILPVTITEILPKLLNAGELMEVCTGTPFNFIPESNLEGTRFDWTRAVQSGIQNPQATGVGQFQETLVLTSAESVTVVYTYRLSTTQCSFVGADLGEIKVQVHAAPDFTLADDTVKTCSPTVDLRTLHPVAADLTFSYFTDSDGKNRVAQASMVLPGSYYIFATNTEGCQASQLVEIRSRINIPVQPDTLAICPPQQANLVTVASGRGLTPTEFSINYFSDLIATQPVLVPNAVSLGAYYIQALERQSGCTALIPVAVESGLASMDSPLAAGGHCADTEFTYTPTSKSRGVTFTWELLDGGNALDTLRGAGKIAAVLGNETDSIQTTIFRIVASSTVCPGNTPSYQVQVQVIPVPQIGQVIAPQSPLANGDTVVVGVLLSRPIPAARLNWEASYGRLQGGLGKATGVSFGERAIEERLFNLGIEAQRVLYRLTPVFPGGKLCQGSTDSVQITIESEGVLGNAEIAGAIRTNFGDQIYGVEVGLSGNVKDFWQITNTAGVFRFTGLQARYDYTLTPSLDKDHRNGVSTRDIITLQQHLLGIKQLPNPYRMIAADINATKTITIADAIAMRRLILGYTATFPGNSSWRFVDAAYRFPNQQNPWAEVFPEIKNFNDLEGRNQVDFIGVKIGDLNGDAKVAPIGTVTPNSSQVFTLKTINPELQPGDQVLLPIQVGAEGLEGAQFSLLYDQRALQLDVTSSIFPNPEYIGMFNESGFLTCAWDQALNAGDTLMTLSFKVLQKGNPASWLEVNSRLTTAEGYQADRTLPIVLEFSNEGTTPIARVLQNYPNPFKTTTILPFWLPKQESVWLRIYEINGRLVYERSGLFNGGQNRFEISAELLPEGNLWYYQIGGADWVEVKQMMRY